VTTYHVRSRGQDFAVEIRLGDGGRENRARITITSGSDVVAISEVPSEGPSHLTDLAFEWAEDAIRISASASPQKGNGE